MKMQRKNLLGATIILALAASSAYAGLDGLSSFIDSVSATIPNKLDWGLKSEVSYDSNLFSEPKSRRTDSFVWKNGVYANLHRQVESLGAYGLNGSVTYDYYTRKSSDKNDLTVDVFPYINGSIGGGNYLTWSITMMGTAKRERMSSGDTRYARHYNYTISLGADYQYHPRWGVMGLTSYSWHHYPQSEFLSYSKQTIDVSIAPYYRISEKVRIGLRMALDSTYYRNHDTNDDSRRLRYTVFADWVPREYLSVYAEAGVEKSYYDGKTRDTNSERSYLPSGLVTVRYLPVQNFGVSYTSKISTKDSTTNRCLVVSYANYFTVNWEITKKIALFGSTGITVEDQKEGHADTREWFATTRLDYMYSERLRFYLGYEYTNVHYIHVHDNDYDSSVVKLGATLAM